MEKNLTNRQQQILDFIDLTIRDRGYPPSVREIAEAKMKDLNANDIDQAAKIIAGSARSMGIEVAG